MVRPFILRVSKLGCWKRTFLSIFVFAGAIKSGFPSFKEILLSYLFRGKVIFTKLGIGFLLLVFERGRYVFERGRYIFERSRYVFERSRYVFERSRYVFERSHYAFERSRYVFGRSRYVLAF